MQTSLKLMSGYQMPVVGLGTWKSPTNQVQNAVECAIECGYRHIDCALIYQNENEVGNAVSGKIKDGKVKREDLFITSKLWNAFHQPEDVRPSLMETLKNLQTDYLDLYLMHWPFGFLKPGKDQPFFPFQLDDIDYVATWKALEALQKEGLVRSIGVSNFNEFQMKRILKECDIPPAVNQVELNPYLVQPDLVKFCKEKGIVVTAYSPLGSADHPEGKKGDPILLENPKLVEIAAKFNKTVAQVALRFQIQQDVIVIPKSVTPSRIKENLDIFDFILSKEDMEAIEGIDKNIRKCSWDSPGMYATKHKYYPFKQNYTE